MKFQDSAAFKLNEDYIYLDKGDVIHLTSSGLEDELFTMDNLAKEVFQMSLNDFSYLDMREVCEKTLEGTKEEAHAALDELLNTLVEKKILILNET